MSAALSARKHSLESGLTLIELMIAVAIITIAIVGLMASFSGILHAIQYSKNKTLASTLAQEKMQSIKGQSYYSVLPTSNPSFLPDATPYDTAFFPPETILKGGVSFQRFTYVQVMTESNSVLNTLPPSTPDTGIRLITITLMWREGARSRKLSITSIMSNPSSVMTNSLIAGTVLDAGTNQPINGALVDIAENVGWRNTTNNSGNYTINLMPGSYNVVASAQGYFTQYNYQSAAANHTTEVNFLLTQMSSGSVTGTIWVNPTALISQVVASTTQANGMVAQYIELFNPTPYPVVVYDGVQPRIKLNYQTAPGDILVNTCVDPLYGIKLVYVNTTIAPGGYYMVANTTTFMAGGAQIMADAYFDNTANTSCSPFGGNWNTGLNPPVKQIISIGQGGALWLTDVSGKILSSMGWSHNGNSNAQCFPNCYNLGAAGLVDNEQLVRLSSPGLISATFGRAYDSENTSVDFTTSAPLQYMPFSTSDSVQTVIAGRPAVGAVISATDGLSAPVLATRVGNPPIAQFSLTHVATGTWTVLITSGAYQVENDAVTIENSGSVYIFPSSTTILNQPTAGGFISGIVTDAFGSPIAAPAVSVSGGGASVTANTSSGLYVLRVSTGLINVTANSGNSNSSYVAISSLAVPVALGVVTGGVNFFLSQGGSLSGFVTRDGVNPLPGIAIAALDENGNEHDQEVSDNNGLFTTINIATGVYTVAPVLDAVETSSPTAVSMTVLAGQTVFSGSFTITGALGTVSGSVSQGGSPIATGVLIIITTVTFSSPAPEPPTLSAASLTGGPYYITSSREDGTYSIGVRQSTSPAYNIYGYYMTPSNRGAVSTNVQQLTNVPVLAGQVVTGQNLTW